LVSKPWVKKALLHQKLGSRKVVCNLCERRCLILEGKVGFCGTRKNLGGELYTLQYGLSSGISANPIEKKPFFHFWPGSRSLTIGSFSCNFTCPWCQNWHISKHLPEPSAGEFIEPRRFVELVGKAKCRSTSVSFNEPTLLFEWSLEVFRLAKLAGYENTFVTNGYMTLEALRALHEAGLDAMCIDVKGDEEAVKKYCGADVGVVWRNAREARKLGMHVEIVNLLIPGVNDGEEQIRGLVKRHLKEVGTETPLHFTAYYPSYEFSAPPTPVSTLERARKLAVGEGVSFVYVGNVPGHPYENTYCPDCGELLIERYGFEVVKAKLEGGSCRACQRKIPVVGKVGR
jgi:pyruvate formate lyase activating enzyme